MIEENSFDFWNQHHQITSDNVFIGNRQNLKTFSAFNNHK